MSAESGFIYFEGTPPQGVENSQPQRDFNDYLVSLEFTFPPVTEWFTSEYPTTDRENYIALRHAVRRYKRRTNQLLRTDGLLHSHPWIRRREFLMQAMHYAVCSRLMGFDVEYVLGFCVREHSTRQMRIGGQDRLVSGREVFESFDVNWRVQLDPGGEENSIDTDEYGHYLSNWPTVADRDQ